MAVLYTRYTQILEDMEAEDNIKPEPKKDEPSESEKAKADYDRWCEIVSKLDLDLRLAKETRSIKKRHWEALQKLEDETKGSGKEKTCVG